MQTLNPSTHVRTQIEVCCISYEGREMVFERKEGGEVI